MLGLPAGTSYRLLLPEQWVRLPVNSVGMRAAARRHLETRFADLPRDSTLALRRRLEDELVGLAETVSGQFAVDILLLSMDIGGLPVSASGLVSLVPIPLSDEEQLERLRQTTSPDADSSEVVDLGSNRMVRVLRHAEPTTADGEPVEAAPATTPTVLGPDDGTATPLTGRARILGLLRAGARQRRGHTAQLRDPGARPVRGAHRAVRRRRLDPAVATDGVVMAVTHRIPPGSHILVRTAYGRSGPQTASADSGRSSRVKERSCPVELQLSIPVPRPTWPAG